MKHLFETLKSARWIELLLICALLCVFLALALDERSAVPDTQEARMAEILSSVSGAGKVEVLLGSDQQGALVLAEGAGDISVLLSLQQAVRTLTGLPIDKIEIVQMD